MAESMLPIAGVEYPMPSLPTLTVGEARILGQMYTGGLTELMSGEESFDLDVIAALMVIAYMRGNPHASRKTAEQVVNSMPLEDLRVIQEEDAGPPEQRPSEPEPSESPASSDESTPSSGDDASNGSVTLAALPSPTGTPVSATPSEDSDHATLAS